MGTFNSGRDKLTLALPCHTYLHNSLLDTSFDHDQIYLPTHTLSSSTISARIDPEDTHTCAHVCGLRLFTESVSFFSPNVFPPFPLHPRLYWLPLQATFLLQTHFLSFRLHCLPHHLSISTGTETRTRPPTYWYEISRQDCAKLEGHSSAPVPRTVRG